jgi:hypothetical protein
MKWTDVVVGILFLISPVNVRYQLRKARERSVRRGRDIEGLVRFVTSGTLRAFYVVVFVAGVVLVVVGASSSS